MNNGGMSDKSRVPKKPSNKGRGRPRPAEGVEGRDLAKGNSGEQTRFWTHGQVDLQHALDRIRKAARRDKGLRFTRPYPSQRLCVTTRGRSPVR